MLIPVKQTAFGFINPTRSDEPPKNCDQQTSARYESAGVLSAQPERKAQELIDFLGGNAGYSGTIALPEP